MFLFFSKKERMERKARIQVLKLSDEILDQKVKIQGTEFDRKRKCTKDQLLSIQEDIRRGMSVKEVAKKHQVSEWIVRYNTDSNFKAHQIALRSKKSKAHINTMDFEDRVAYKRRLVKRKKIQVSGVI